MNLIKKVLKIGSMAVVTLLLALCGLCVYAEDATYTTQGGDWIQVGDNLWAIDKDNDGQADTDSSGNYSITLTKNGNTWVYRFAVQDPDATYYAWEELPEDSDYEISGGYGSRETPIQINGGDSYTGPTKITNKSKTGQTQEYGSLTLSKTVNGDTLTDADKSKNFKFTVTLTDETEGGNLQKYLEGVQTFGEVTFEDGVAAVTLKHGETVTMENIPAGVTYTVTETPAEGYTLTSWEVSDETTLDGNSAVTGTIKEGDTAAAVTCTNTKTPTQEEETGKFSVKKTVENGEEGAEFTFRAALFGLAPGTNYTCTVAGTAQTFRSDASGMADVEFTLQDGQTAEFEGLPVGCQYQVLEAAAEGYTAAYIIEGTNVQAVRGQQSNTEPGEELSTARETLEKGEEATVHFTNTKPAPNPDAVSIPVTKKWEDSENLNDTRPESITVYLLQSASSTEPGDVVATALLDETNNWTYTFDDLDKYQPNSETPYIYTVQEEQVPGYTTAVTGDAENGYTITNTAAEVGKLKISKTVAGQTDDTTEFRFTLTLEDAENNPITGAYPLDDTGENAKTGTLYFDNGTASFTLKSGEHLTLTALPVGAVYTLTEASYSGYLLEAENLTGTIVTDETKEVNAVNRRLHDLTVSKTVEGSMGDKTKDFAFILTLSLPEDTADAGLAVPDSVNYTKGGESGTMEVTDGKVTFTLTHGESITFKGLPAGLSYAVVEDGTVPVLKINDGYDVTIPETSSGTLNSDVTAAFTNTRNGTVPTGLVMTVFPFALVALLGGAGLIWYAARKKRRGQVP